MILNFKHNDVIISDRISYHFTDIKRKRNIYKFNRIGLFVVAVNYKYRKDNYFYCAEFVKYLFDSAGIKNDIPELVKPMDFEDVKKLRLVYEGMLSEYKV